MPVDKIRPFNDPRISLRSALLNGHTYGYLYSPASPSTRHHQGTIILIHGFPDISFGWRYQIPLLTSLGLDVIALDCLGYGRSDSPGSSHLGAYTFSRIADDVATLAHQLHLSSVLLGGHDWGGAIVYRVQQYHPSLIRAFFSICTPYFPPTPTYLPLQHLVSLSLPNFRYQLHLASGAVESAVRSPSEIRNFLHALYGGRTPAKEVGFVAESGVMLDRLPRIQPSRLVSEDEMDYYVGEYARHGINGPLNWYRTRELNFVDEYRFFFEKKEEERVVSSSSSSKTDKHKHKDKDKDKEGGEGEMIRVKGCEVLFVQADKDAALTPKMSEKMAERVDRLTWKHVSAGHWCLWEKPEECNEIIRAWLEEKVFGKGVGSGSGSGRSSKL